MFFVKFVDNGYTNQWSITNLVFYILNLVHMLCDYYGAFGVSLTDETEMIQGFRETKRIYGKTDGRQARHVIVSFDSAKLDGHMLFDVAYDICRYYGERYQTVFAVHMNEPNIHLHIVFNTTNYITGRQYSAGDEDLWSFREHIKNVIEQSKYRKYF